MQPSAPIHDFIRRALASGADPAGIDTALAAAGWAERERADALAGWLVLRGLPPVPRPRPYVSAREALLYGLLFVSLGMLAAHLVQIGFRLVEILWPEPGERPYLPGSGLRWPMAVLITFTPVFLILNRMAQRRSAAQAAGRSLVRRWFAAITLLIAVLTLLGDAVVTIYALLDGEIALRFALKSAIVAAVAGLILAYYRDEADD
ncbi:DUF5671 domain-containing protein [Paracoccus jeotgali]|uniref:DUF5671 domain-containing protein n=1 Tax=Paracoccus jeotgali TaxID=2065379 RepID=UPI0028A89394|nr:DUF5671 domain-containing protein [Paracoccus jeotgali]